MQTRKVSRRQLLRGLSQGSAVLGAGALLAACAPQQAAPAAPAATTAPAAAATAVPAAAEPTAAAESPTVAAEAAPTTAPAAGAGGTVQVIHRQEYFKGLEDALKQQTEEYITSLGFTPDVSTANAELFGDFVAKMQAAVAAGNPPDLSYHTLAVSQLYDGEIVEDHTALVDELVGKYGEVVPVNAALSGKFEGKWWSVPFISNSGAWFVRKDIAEAAGVDLNDLGTLEKRRDAALKMSDPSKEMYGWGLTVNKSGDGHGTIQSAFQAFGGRAVDETGNKITFNSPETIEGIKFLADIYMNEKYKPMLPPGIESWTDPSNNEAYLAGKTGMTQNAFSIYAAAKKDNLPVFPNTAVVQFPTTNDGKISLGSGGSGWYSIMKGAKQQDAAKQIINHFIDPAVFAPLSILGGGLNMPAYKNSWSDDLVKADPAFATLKEIIFSPVIFTGFAYPAQTNAAIDAWFNTGFLSEMMTNIISGKMTVEAAVEDATKKGIDIFEEKGLPQS